MPASRRVARRHAASINWFNDLTACQPPPLPQQSILLAADGSRLATFYAENRIDVSIDKISPMLQQAMVAIEDSRFYEHDGVDLRGTLRALVTNSQSGGRSSRVAPP